MAPAIACRVAEFSRGAATKAGRALFRPAGGIRERVEIDSDACLASLLSDCKA